MAKFGTVSSSTILDRQVILTADQFRKGATAPTDVTIGTTPTVEALLFDAEGELVSTFFQFPTDMDKSVDPKLILLVSLSSTQINNDVLDFALDYTVSLKNSTGSGIAKTSTNISGVVTVTTANGLAIGDIYEVEFDFDAADATNPMSSGTGTALELHLDNVTGVADIHVVSACFLYRSKY